MFIKEWHLVSEMLRQILKKTRTGKKEPGTELDGRVPTNPVTHHRPTRRPPPPPPPPPSSANVNLLTTSTTKGNLGPIS